MPDVFEDLSETYRPAITGWLAPMNEETRELLLPAMEAALDGIERACPVAMQTTADGLRVAYGPEGLQEQEIMVILATPRTAVWMAIDNLPPYCEPPRGFTSGAYWKVIHDFITKGDFSRAVGTVAIRMGRLGLENALKVMTDFRAQKFTPTLLVMVGLTDSRAAGCCGVLPLPARIEDQLDA